MVLIRVFLKEPLPSGTPVVRGPSGEGVSVGSGVSVLNREGNTI